MPPSDRTPVRTTLDLASLDDGEMREGYAAAWRGEPCPPEASRSFWHGWRNGCVDNGRAEVDEHMRALAREIFTLTTMPVQGRA
ncbi:hypothetical protein KQX64_06900 [Rhodopseudomonas palustris]|nr:hypothetical protein KQX64_06900 [Rhodopseudomonas palustris]